MLCNTNGAVVMSCLVRVAMKSGPEGGNKEYSNKKECQASLHNS
jgi:hypothetical protein